MQITGALRQLARRERVVVAFGLAVIFLAGWAYLMRVADGMAGASGGMTVMPGLAGWSVMDAVFMFLMWAVMMATMMIPSAAPMILLYTAIRDKAAAPAQRVAHSGMFAAGYLAVWTGFSAAATGLQWALETAALLSPMMVSTGPVLGGGLLIVVGLYQMTPWKHACLQNCRSPAQFISQHWRTGPGGAFRMGVAHGMYCLGCCWALMLLLFVGGVMSFLWIAGLSAFVLAEKVVPRGATFGRVAGGVLLVCGVWLLVW